MSYALSVGNPRACTLQPLHQSRHVEPRRQLDDQVHVITQDADLYYASSMPICFPEKEPPQKIGYRFIDQG